MPPNQNRPQIVATLGPSSQSSEMLEKMIDAGMNVARLNLSWGPTDEHVYFVQTLRTLAQKHNAHIPIIFDLSGPRVQEVGDHHFGNTEGSVITPKDRQDVELGIVQGVEYFALSYVGAKSDVEELRSLIARKGGEQKIIAKIERKVALEHAQEILEAADALMVARGDLGHEVPLAEIPFDEISLVEQANAAGKPVIVATDMMPSMIEHQKPTRSDVTDVAFAALVGADAVMLSNETTKGAYPVETIAMMAAILDEVVVRGFTKTFHRL